MSLLDSIGRLLFGGSKPESRLPHIAFVSAGTALPAQSGFLFASADSLDAWLQTASPTDLPLGCTIAIFYAPTTMDDGSLWIPCVFVDGDKLTKGAMSLLDVYVDGAHARKYRADVYVATVGVLVEPAP